MVAIAYVRVHMNKQRVSTVLRPSATADILPAWNAVGPCSYVFGKN